MAALAGVLLVHDRTPGKQPRVVFTSVVHSNGECFVSFRAEPPSAEIACADMVPGSYDGQTQPPTVRSFGHTTPATIWTNCLLRVVAIPQLGGWMGGKPMAYTPGSYTVAFTPSGSAHRVRIGVALTRSQTADFRGRLGSCLEARSLGPLNCKTYGDPVFVTSDPIVSASPEKP
jgi:hypothetical protein